MHLSFFSLYCRGTAPTGIAAPVIGIDGSKHVTVTWTAPSDPGTLDGTNYAQVSAYKIVCSGAVSFTTTGVAAGTYTYTAVTLTTNTDGPVTCVVTATNTASLSVSATATTPITAQKSKQ